MKSLLNQPISLLCDKHPGETLHVVGSGPSLADLTASQIGAGPICTINHAIRKVEQLDIPNPVYSMQKDQAYADCRAPILAHSVESARDGRFGDYVFDCEIDFGIPWNTPSIVVCLHLARLMGCAQVEYHCCDSFRGDYRSYDGVNRPVSDRRALQYIYHPGMVQAAAQGLGMTWTAL